MRRKCCGTAGCPGNPYFGNTKCKCGHWWFKDSVVGGCPMCNAQSDAKYILSDQWKLLNVRPDGAHIFGLTIVGEQKV